MGKGNIWRRMGKSVSMFRMVFVESLGSFLKNNQFETAATLAYYGFFSLMPLLLLMMIVMSRVLFSSQTAMNALENFIGEIFPQFADVILRDVYRLSLQRIWGLLSIVILLWSITPFAGAIRSAFLRIFKTDQRVPFLKARLLDMAAVLALLTALVLLVVARIFFSMAQEVILNHFFFLRSMFGFLLPLLVTILSIAFFFRVFAPVRPGWTAVMTGALTAVAMLFVLRPAFEFMLKYNSQYGFAFGSLKAIFVIMVWVYYAFAVMMFGAEVMANMRRKEVLLLRKLFARGVRVAIEPGPLIERFVAEYDLDTVLFREGDRGGEMFYVLSGAVELSRGSEVIRRMEAGEYLGEMSMLIDAPRTATATIRMPGTRLIVISQDNFETILRENPVIVRSILVEMANRLKRTTEAISNR